ncbi:MAG: protein kinase [Candidatus Latescibacteria bacterium]|nr:protein kinase [Candidatus Latescibacterota bacterium]
MAVDPLIGQELGGYRITGLVGRGGMGSVYRARDEGLRRDIALKLLRLDTVSDTREAERFRREARLAAALNHPNIVAIYGTGNEGGHLYLAMELVDGDSLRALLRIRRGALSVERSLAIVEQVLEALKAAHQHGIIHRDIKPENILVRKDEIVKVLDFGVAKLEGGTLLTRADELLGTVEYMAPEQILGESIGPAADLYAAGVLLYELVTGALPFAGESPATLVYHQLNEEPPSPSLLNPAVPRALDLLVSKLLGKLPEDRYGSAAEALVALRGVQRRQQVASVPGSEKIPADAGEEEFRARDFRFRFTGRQAELEALTTRYDAAAKEGRLVFVGGEAGIGKTRLVDELARHIEGHQGRVIQGACFFEHGMGPYMPFLDAIGKLFSKEQNGLTEREREGLGRLLRQQAPELAELAAKSSTTAKVRASFAAAFGKEGDPKVARQRLCDAICELLAAAAAEVPLAVILEDMHWADEGSLQLLQSLVRRAAEARILWVVTYRPEELGGEGGLAALLQQLHAEGLLDDLRLERLGREALTRMVKSVFTASEFTEEFGDFLYGQSQGNPLVAAEVLKVLRQREVLYCDSGVWTVRADLGKVEVPGRINALIIQRLDQLDNEDRELLQVAAVVGQHFTSEVLGAATGLSRIALLKALFRLEKKNQLLASAASGYEFSHSKIREVLYAEIPGELRREYHGIVAQALEAMRAQGREVDDEEVGIHLYEVGEYERAFPCLLRAGDQVFALCGWRQAATLFDQAATAGRHFRAETGTLIHALQRSSTAYINLTAYDQALERCEELREAARQAQRPADEAKGWKITGQVRDAQRRFDEALAAYEQALNCLNNGAFPALRGLVLKNWGCVDFECGRHAQAATRWQESLQLLQDSAPEEVAGVLNNLAVLETVRGHQEEAWALYERVLALDGTGGRDGMLALWNMGMLRADQERWDEALELYRQSLEKCKQIRCLFHQPSLELNMAEALLGKGDLGGARRVCGSALRWYRRLDDALGVADASRLYGRLCRLEENWEDSSVYLERSVQINRQFGNSVSLGEALYELGLLRRERGMKAAALELLQEAEKIFTQVEALPDLGRVQAALSELQG